MNKIVLAFALLTCACSAAPRHVSLERWKSDLELHIQTTRAQATPGERLPVQFRIANHGRERAVACP